MIVRFFDRQAKSNPLNGKIISASDFLSTLEDLRKREPFFFELVAENDYSLLVGLANELGSVQYSAITGDPPFLMALAPGGQNRQGYVEFLTADTATPVPRRYAIDFDLVRKIVVHFLETAEINPNVDWEEV